MVLEPMEPVWLIHILCDIFSVEYNVMQGDMMVLEQMEPVCLIAFKFPTRADNLAPACLKIPVHS